MGEPDRFFLDPGHMSPMLYSILTLMGHYSLEDLQGFRQWEVTLRDILNVIYLMALKILPSSRQDTLLQSARRSLNASLQRFGSG